MARKSIPKKTRETVLSEAGYKCASPTCGTILALDLHHIIEVSEGGGNGFENLIALCPTCHRLFHRGEISRNAITDWKKRIVKLNEVFDIEEAIRKQISAQIDKSAPANGGFSGAVREFLPRCFQIGPIDGTRFVEVGIATFVDESLVLTTRTAVEWIQGMINHRGGEMCIFTNVGVAPLEVEEFPDWGDLAFLKVGQIDRSAFERVSKGDKSLEKFLPEPLQTKIRFRPAPLVGEAVGFLHSPDSSKPSRLLDFPQFDTAHVSFYRRTEPCTLSDFVMTPCPSKFDHRGSPVFSEDGSLVGVMVDSVLLPDESIFRPVAASLLGVKRFMESELK